MCDQTESNYLDGEVVWVKLGTCFWPGEVVDSDKLPPDLLPSFRKPPIAVVKFFQEDTYEYIKNTSQIFKYNCSKKDDFIRKGLAMFRSKHGHMEKFPEDVIRAETATGGDPTILTREEFQENYQEPKKKPYGGIFGEPAKKSTTVGKRGRKGGSDESPKVSPAMRKFHKGNNDYKAHILVQGSKPATQPCELSTPSTSRAGSEPVDEKSETAANADKAEDKTTTTPSSPASANPGVYSCPTCSFNTTRLNVLILHNKMHSISYTPYTPSPIRKISDTKTIPKSSLKSTKSPLNITKTPKARPRKDKPESTSKKSQLKKRVADDNKSDVKKIKTEEAIKTSLLADWDDCDEESTEDTMPPHVAHSPEAAAAAESPAEPTSAEMSSAQVPDEPSLPSASKSDEQPKPNHLPVTTDSKYEFCEDEDWPVEAGVGRIIPRVKNPSKRKDETKSVSLDGEDIAREVAELLTKTAVPELPTAPEPLKVEENFPEPSIVKSPDKETPKATEVPKEIIINSDKGQPTKTIFKTKTFFRSRHSRSQDAIGKYVAEQLNAAERMDISENELNGSEVVSSPEARDSPPIEQVRVARLAPKIQLKKMKAEYAQLKEREKCDADLHVESLLATASEKSVSEDTRASFTRSEQSLNLLDVTKINPQNVFSKKDNGGLDSNKSPTDSQKKNLGALVSSQEITEAFIDNLNKSEEAKTVEQSTLIAKQVPELCLNETTALAVDALLSVSRENDRVTKMISSGPPEDLFEDDKYDVNNVTISDDQSIEVIQPVSDKNGTEIENNTISHETTLVSKELTETLVQEIEYEDVNAKKVEANVEEKCVSDVITEHNIDHNIATDIIVAENQAPKTTADAYDHEYSAASKSSQREIRITEVESNGFCIKHMDKKEENTNGITYENTTENIVDEETKDQHMFAEQRNTNDMVQSINQVVSEPIGQVIEVSKTEVVHTYDEINTTDLITSAVDNGPSESDLQIAEALINLPSTALQNKIKNERRDSTMSFESQDSKRDIFIEDTVIPAAELVQENTKTEPDFHDSLNVGQESQVVIEENVQSHYETEEEKSENLNAAQSLVQMSETLDHKLKKFADSKLVDERAQMTEIFTDKVNDSITVSTTIEQNLALLSSENESKTNLNTKPIETSSRLLKILEEPFVPKPPCNKVTPTKAVSNALLGKEKILNFDAGKPPLSPKLHCSPKQKIIIRRTIPNKNLINNLAESNKQEKIILSRSNKPTPPGSSVQTFTIQASPDAVTENSNAVIIQQKARKIQNIPQKFQKIKPQTPLITFPNETKVFSQASLITIQNEPKPIKQPSFLTVSSEPKPTMPSIITVSSEPKSIAQISPKDKTLFDINSMPVVLSDQILTPESIDKMPIVMSDGNIISTPSKSTNIIKPVKVKQTVKTVIETEKLPAQTYKPELKTLLMNPVPDVSKSAPPNILSKSTKIRGAKPLLIIDKATGKQKIVMTKAEPAVKEVKKQPIKMQTVNQSTGKTEKYIILPANNAPRPNRTQKIVIDPQTGKTHVVVANTPETKIRVPESKPVSAKLLPATNDANSPGSTVMIITNAQGTQSRIVLTPEHEKLLFPKKQQPNATHIKPATVTNSSLVQKPQSFVTTVSQTVVKPPTKIVSKQKNTIITSKGQLIVGARPASTVQNIAPMPEIRSAAPKQIIAANAKKAMQTIQKNSPEPLIFLQQKSGAVLQLTAAQFEHLHRTGQIVQKPASTQPPVQEAKTKKQITITSNEAFLPIIQKQTRVRSSKSIVESASAKKAKLDKFVSFSASSPLPALAPLSNTSTSVPASALVQNQIAHLPEKSSNAYSDLENFEDLLPSTAIARQTMTVFNQQSSVPFPDLVQQEMVPQPELVVQSEMVLPPDGATAAEQVIQTEAGTIGDGQLLAFPGEHFGGPPNSFYLCLEDNGTLTPIDNRPLILENNQLVPMAIEQPPIIVPQPETARRDILEAALVNSDVFHSEPNDDSRDLNANIPGNCRETSTIQQPIMTPVEVPSNAVAEPALATNLEDSLAVLGVTPQSVPTSLALPITVTDPRIAPKTSDPLSNNTYGPPPLITSPSGELPYVTSETETPCTGPISMPLLTEDEDDGVGKSMPILTDDLTERTASSVESAVDSPSSIDVRDSEIEDGGSWSRRLLTPGSDTSETSSEIPLQPAIQISVNELSRNS